MFRNISSSRGVTTLVAAGLLAVAGRATSVEPQKPKKSADAEPMVVKVYDVRRLIQGDTQPLKDLLTSVIAPQTWEENGGEATLSILGTKLTVRQSADVHENIGALLEALGKLPAPSRKIDRAVPRKQQVHVGTQKIGDTEMQIAIYPVGDLTVGRHGFDGSIHDHLATTVAPKSWAENGGAGTIQAYPPFLVLVVSNTSDVQKELAGVLNKLRSGGKGGRGKK